MFDLEEPSQKVGTSKKRKCGEGESYTELDKDEQAVSEASLNKLVGAADHYDLMVILTSCNYIHYLCFKFW